MEKYYTVQEVCEILHKSDRTVYAYIKGGQLRAKKVSRKSILIPESALNELINKGIEPGYYERTYPRRKKENVTPNK